MSLQFSNSINVPTKYLLMLWISFPFRLFEAGERNRTSFERDIIADISSVLGEIRVQRKRKNKDIAVAQKVYCILLRIYSLGLANLNLANSYMSTSSALARSFSQGPFQMSCHVIVMTGTDLKCELIQAFLSLNLFYSN